MTIALDREVVEHFTNVSKQAAAQRGALPYQTQINQALRQAIEQPATQALGSELRKDKEFIHSCVGARSRKWVAVVAQELCQVKLFRGDGDTF